MIYLCKNLFDSVLAWLGLKVYHQCFILRKKIRFSQKNCRPLNFIVLNNNILTAVKKYKVFWIISCLKGLVLELYTDNCALSRQINNWKLISILNLLVWLSKLTLEPHPKKLIFFWFASGQTHAVPSKISHDSGLSYIFLRVFHSWNKCDTIHHIALIVYDC